MAPAATRKAAATAEATAGTSRTKMMSNQADLGGEKVDEPEPDGDDDPVTATYPVFLNPALPSGRRLLVLQYPNRADDSSSSAASRAGRPSELRLKPASGMVEVDMPLDSSLAYDRDKGLRWGRALHASMAAKNGGSHGLAGGFGFGAAGPGARKRAGDAGGPDTEILDWNDAVRQGRVLNTQTLGGQCPDTNEVKYMVGVFQGKNLHLTPVSSLVHLRPQLHHIDATAQQERQSVAGAGSRDGAASGAGGTATSGARAIHMTIKTTADGDSVTTETIADRLRAVQSEHWRRLRYVDENDEAAWDVFNESLFLRSQVGGGGGHDTDADADAAENLEASTAKIGSTWNDAQLLEAVSGMDKAEPAEAPETAAQTQTTSTTPGAKPTTTRKAPGEAPRRAAASSRPRAGGAAGSARRGRGGKAAAAGAAVVDVD